MGLREGFTTGSCAAAAALACCLWQRDGRCPAQVSVVVPEGRTYTTAVIAHPNGCCGVIKDSGDDPDITGGMEVIAHVEPLPDNGEIRFRAGEGVGVVTESGLKLPKGEPAINPVPRQMICDAVRSVLGARGAVVTVSIPGGLEAARKTFNPRLGIVGGLSILGTSGVVRPMSDEALREALLVELKMCAAQKVGKVIFTFGNQGEEVMRKLFPGLPVIQVSNELGFMLDAAAELGIIHLLIGGHPGKLAKVAAGVMQTHSRTADARREAVVTHLALLGAPRTLIENVYACVTTDEAIRLIDEAGLNAVWDRLAQAARRYCLLRVRNEIRIEVVFTDARGAILGQCLEAVE